MDTLPEDRRPLFVAVIEADLKDEARVAHPEELLVALPHQGDAVPLGKTSADRPGDLAVAVQRHEPARVKSDDFAGTCDDDPIVGPRARRLGNGRQIGPVECHVRNVHATSLVADLRMA